MLLNKSEVEQAVAKGVATAMEPISQRLAHIAELTAVEARLLLKGAEEPSRARAEVLLSPKDKKQIALDRLFGVETSESELFFGRDIPAFRGLLDAFRHIMGHEMASVQGRRITNAQETVLASTWPTILGASMNRRLAQEYGRPAYGEDKIISVLPGLRNLKPQVVLRIDSPGDLSDADPESQDFPEVPPLGEESITYDVKQKGNILTVTRRVLLGDDIGALRQTIDGLGRAARRTLARFFWSHWIDNAVYGADSKAWFHADHGNLKTQALTADLAGANEVLDAVIKLGKMTEPGSGERLGLPELSALGLWLVVPIDLVGVANGLNTAPLLPDATDDLKPNPVFGLFGEKNERIIVNPLLTDTSDWGVFVDPAAVASFQVGFFDNQRVPELIVGALPMVGQMFVSDKQGYKLRYEFGGNIVDFRGGVKSVVAS